MGKRLWLILLAEMGAALLYSRSRRASGQEASGSWEFSGPMARVYDQLFSSAINGFYRTVARRLAETAPAGNVLDVGCGPGRLAVALATEAPGLMVTGIDISPDMIELARRRAEASNLSDRLRFQVADVAALPFPDNEFDLVVSTLSMHHWPDPARGLSEIYRVLKPTGNAYIYDLADWFLRLTHHGASRAQFVAESPFASNITEPLWSVGPVPVVTSSRLGE